jgi:NADH-quinone oxidoreductase subunit C
LPDETPEAPEETGASPSEAGVAEPTPEPEAELEAEPEATPDPAHVELLARLERALPGAVIEHGDALGELVVRVTNESWGPLAEVCKRDLECDFLSFVSGIDWAPAPKEGGDDASGDTSSPVQPSEMTFGVAGSAGRFQVFAHVQSTARHWGLTFKVDVDEQRPTCASWVGVYPGADWHERETWEMYGVVFDGHPSLRQLYLPAGFEGHPLRKDFPLLARVVKPWPGLVDVEAMPEVTGEPSGSEATSDGEPVAVGDGGEGAAP